MRIKLLKYNVIDMGLFNKVVVGLVIVCSLITAFTFRTGEDTGIEQLRTGFKTIPDSMLLSIYWYWMSDNISKEGVVKDLQAMKKVGINSAFIGNIGGQGVPYGKVKIFSDEWWDILHTALKTATELNIEIGIFNSPGWSQSGGPWVKPEQSMRYLNSSELTISGPQKLKQILHAPSKDFHLVKVLAFPVNSGTKPSLYQLKPAIASMPDLENIRNLFDGDNNTITDLPENKPLEINISLQEDYTVRSLIVQTAKKPIKAKGELQVKVGNTFKTLSTFDINRSNPNIIVGFKPYAPVVISVPETKSREFRIVITGANKGSGLSEIELLEEPMMERYPEKTLAKMFQTPLPYWHDYMWPVQPGIEGSLAIDPANILDLTSFVQNDSILEWQVPQGTWKVMYSGMTTTGVVNEPASPEGTGLETDKMSKKHIAAHFDAFLGEIIRRIPEADRKCWKMVVEDSYERGGQNWTDGFGEEFKARYGYDPTPFIPVINGYVVKSRDVSDRFLWDLRRLVADKVAYDYVGGLREISHQHGLRTWLENYGHWGFPGEFLQYGGQSDEIGGEFWSEGELGNIENRAASSCAHIYGKRKVSAESFTCGGRAYSRHPATMKQRGDRFFTEGINNTLMHVYIQQPDEHVPGINAGFGNEFNRHNTWFYYLDMFGQYLKRCNYMLQQGTYVADVAYFIGEDVPKMTGICDPELPAGYSFDYINAEVLHTRIRVENNKIVLPDGMSYRMLVLPQLSTIRPELLDRIKDLVSQGAVVLGPRPSLSPSLQNYPECDRRVQNAAADLWGKVDGKNVKYANYGKGMVLSGMTMQEALDLIGVIPDCKFGNSDSALFIHRKLKGTDVYFLSNQTGKTITINPQFRVSGRKPQLWDATSGETRELPSFHMHDGATSVPLKMSAFESYFIVFNDKAGESKGADVSLNFPDGKVIADLSSNWLVTFSTHERGPARPVEFKTLTDWTTSANDNIKYYSGTAVYKNSVKLDKKALSKSMFLELGNLTSIAKVTVNGQSAGGVWTAPWRIEISRFLKQGENTIEISVVNNWMNRLIGDLNLPADSRPTWSPVIPYKANSPLQPSGLFGPVYIRAVDYKNI